MRKLELTFVNGTTQTIAFGPDSMLTVETPDGVNGVIRGAWGEIVDLAVVDIDDETTDEPADETVADETPPQEQTGDDGLDELTDDELAAKVAERYPDLEPEKITTAIAEQRDEVIADLRTPADEDEPAV